MSNEPFDDRDGYIWYNGKLSVWRDTNVHILNHGLHYASCVFEGIRIYDGKPFKLNEHNERLHNSAKILNFDIPYSVDQLNEATKLIVKEQGVENGYIRPIAWLGSEHMKIYAAGNSVHVAIATWEWAGYFPEELYEKGIDLCWSDWKRPAPDTAPTNSKAAGLYMICTISKKQAQQGGFHDAMMLDYRGYVAEATGANFFMVADGEIHTPIADCFLDGITRRTVIEIAKNNGIKVNERHIKPEELSTAQEAFLTGTAAEITPIGSIAEHKFVPGEVTALLRQEYSKLVRK